MLDLWVQTWVHLFKQTRKVMKTRRRKLVGNYSNIARERASKINFNSIRMVGNSFIATNAIEDLRIKKNFKNGGGVLGGCLKAGDRILIIDCLNDVNSISFSTDITLHRLNQSFFYNEKYFVKDLASTRPDNFKPGNSL